MGNVLNFNNQRLDVLVKKVNEFGAEVIFNDVLALSKYEDNYDYDALMEVTQEVLADGESFGMANARFNEMLNEYEPRYIFMVARDSQLEESIFTLAHELGHILTARSYEDFYHYHTETPKYVNEIHAWKEGIKFLIDNKIKINLDIDDLKFDFNKAITSYSDRIGDYIFNMNHFVEDEKPLKDEVMRLIEEYYEEVVING